MMLVVVFARRRVSDTRAWMHAGSCRCMHAAVMYEWPSVVHDSYVLSNALPTTTGLQRWFANS